MNSCFPPLAALSLTDKSSAGLEKSKQQTSKKKSYWGSNSSLRKSNGGKDSRCLSTALQNSSPSAGMQDLDLYYMKQIAHSLKEFDLEQKIDLEIKMREGSAKLLAACKHPTQSLEAAKNLLVSNERMASYMGELQKRKRDATSSKTLGGYSRARLSLSDLRIPLIWKDIDHFKNKGDYRRFAVFCLAKIGTEMYDTSLLCPIDRSSTDITFPDILLFNRVNPDFHLRLEIYSHMLHDDYSMASAPRRIKNTIHTSITRTVGKKLAAALRDELSHDKLGPAFELLATANLTLDDVHNNIRTHDLRLENSENNRSQLPLFGNFCCRLAAQPSCMVQEMYSGYLNLLVKADREHSREKEKSQWVRCWAKLIGFRLKLWSDYDQYMDEKQPVCAVSVTRDTVILAKRNNSLEIEVSNEYEGSVVLKADSLEDRAKWFRHLTQHVTDHLRWKEASEVFMEIQPAETSRHSFVKSVRHGSLYEQTPILGERFNQSESPANSSGSRKGQNGSSSPFRERLGSSSANSDVRPRRSSYWTFSRNNQQ